MIIGKGLLASAFQAQFGNNSEIIIFASGVSNSLETRREEFARERELLSHTLQSSAKRLVYFSSCGVVVEEQLSPYMEHKKSMEALVLSSRGGLVLRLPQVVGVAHNPHTLTNFLRDRILAGQHFTVWQYAQRNLVDIADVATIGGALATELPLDTSSAHSIAAQESIAMPLVVEMFERALGRRANFSLVEKGSPLPVDTEVASKVASGLDIDLGASYIESVIRKYYATT